MNLVKNSSSKNLIVEGKDDQYTIIHLTEKHGIEWHKKPVQIVDVNGCENVLEDFSVRIKSSERIGIVMDADLNLTNRWQSIRDCLLKFVKQQGESSTLSTLKTKPKGNDNPHRKSYSRCMVDA
jgi:hypothetical protein